MISSATDVDAWGSHHGDELVFVASNFLWGPLYHVMFRIATPAQMRANYSETTTFTEAACPTICEHASSVGLVALVQILHGSRSARKSSHQRPRFLTYGIVL